MRTEEKHIVKITIELDIFEQLRPKVWRAVILYLADYRCEECGDKNNLHAHHIDRDRTNNAIVNGKCFCSGCHIRDHVEEIKQGIQDHKDGIALLESLQESAHGG